MNASQLQPGWELAHPAFARVWVTATNRNTVAVRHEATLIAVRYDYSIEELRMHDGMIYRQSGDPVEHPHLFTIHNAPTDPPQAPSAPIEPPPVAPMGYSRAAESHDRARRQLWREVYVAVTADAHVGNKETPREWANQAVAHYDSKFPEPIPEENL